VTLLAFPHMGLKPENPVVGGTVLRRAAIQSPNFVTGSAGWQISQNGDVEFNSGTFRGNIVGGSLYIYSGVPALGNPPIFWASKGLVDPFGNVLPTIAGVAASGSFGAGDAITYPGGTVGYNGTPAANNMIYSDSPAGFTDPFGNVVLSGRAVYALNTALMLNPAATNILTFTNSSNQSGTWTAAATFQLPLDGTGATPAQLQPGAVAFQPTGLPLVTNVPAGFAALYCATTARFGSLSKDGYSGLFPVVTEDTTVLTNNNLGGANRVTAIYTIPAGNLAVDTRFCIEIPFLATMTGVAADTLELGLSIDGSSSYTANNTINGAIVGAGVSINGVFRVYLRCTATGALTGRIDAWTDGSVNQASAATTFANSGGLAGNLATGVTLDTTASHTIRVNSTWAVSDATQALTVRGSTCTRTGP